MKRLYDFITKANQVLLFLVIIGGTVLIAYLVFQPTRNYEPPHVSVAQTAEEAKGSIVEDVKFLGQSSGLYVFGIMKRVVTTGKEPWRERAVLSSTGYLGSDEVSTGEMVNVVFSKGEQRVRALLQHDGLVLSYQMPGENRSEKIKALLFRCVTEDTDRNHRLDGNDRNDLYVVSEGLERPDLVVKGVLDFDVISPTHLVVKTKERDILQFWDIDTETQAKNEILWK